MRGSIAGVAARGRGGPTAGKAPKVTMRSGDCGWLEMGSLWRVFKQSSLLDQHALTFVSLCSSGHWVRTDCQSQEWEGGRHSLLMGSRAPWIAS